MFMKKAAGNDTKTDQMIHVGCFLAQPLQESH